MALVLAPWLSGPLARSAILPSHPAPATYNDKTGMVSQAPSNMHYCLVACMTVYSWQHCIFTVKLTACALLNELLQAGMHGLLLCKAL